MNAVAPQRAAADSFFGRYVGASGGPWFDWLIFELIGVAIGGVLSAWLAGRLRFEVERGPRLSRNGRLATAFGGGAIMGLGAVLAQRLHERTGVDGRRAAQCWKLAVHDRRVRRRLHRRAARPARLDLTIMRAPFFEFGVFGDHGALIAAVLIGIAFGWCLERAGMGSARKLAGQFYLTDLTVFKVMFSAIITAMLGAFWLGRLGVLDLSRVYVPETYVLPQLVGGWCSVSDS